MKESRLGVIDSLSAGLNLIAQRAWIVAIPILLDLWYWLGPRLSIAPILTQVKQNFVAAAAASMPDPQVTSMVTDMFDALAQHFNLFSLLSAGLMGVPSLVPAGSSAGIIEVRNWPALIGLGALLMVAGLAVGCLYLTLIAQGAREDSVDVPGLLRQAGEMWLRVMALALVVLFFFVALVVPFGFLVGLLMLASSGAALFFIGIFQVSLIWLGLYLYFVVYAILINRVGPLRAIWNSANVVARNFWSAVGLVILILVLRNGLSLVWQRLGDLGPAGTVIGIAGNAFVGAGLAAATLLYYRDRYRQWQQQAA